MPKWLYCTCTYYARTAPQLPSRRDLNIDFKPRDSVWATDVLQEFKHRTEGDKVALSLFPWVGVEKNILRLEMVAYRLKVFTNLTKVALTSRTDCAKTNDYAK